MALFWRNFEISFSFESTRFKESNDFVVVIWSDDKVEVGREPRLDLTNHVASNKVEANKSRL